ncbi:fatty acid desaturase [Streptomyces sp. NPDC088789]|uniref:fatty acid desaturase n=1 Tax=Streptomyces sp. NPDC088789 TaxID=3365899 RepID=UPI003823C8D9
MTEPSEEYRRKTMGKEFRQSGKGAAGNPGSPHLPSVTDADGVRWTDYRRTLTPHYHVVWRDIALCWVSLVAGVAAVPPATAAGPTGVAVVTTLAAGWIGWWLHALFLFGHEAAHGNLARRRRRNDRLGDWSVWLLFGSTTPQYRRTHMAHHTHLGTHQDTETTYHLCLSVANILKGMTGVRVLEVLLRDRRAGASRAPRAGAARDGTPSARRGSGLAVFRQVLLAARTPLLHLLVLAALSTAGWWPAALAWAVGVGCVFPLCAMLRTVAEHRILDASCATDFRTVEHGPLNRLFGEDPLSRTFGAAGFNKHLLHHWDPAISYTRFREMEEFFRRTPLARELESSRTGYLTVLRTMTAEARRG